MSRPISMRASEHRNSYLTFGSSKNNVPANDTSCTRSSSSVARCMAKCHDSVNAWMGNAKMQEKLHAPGCKRHSELRRTAVRVTWVREHVLVELLDDVLKADKLCHGVRDLSRPERHQRTEREATVHPISPHGCECWFEPVTSIAWTQRM